MHPADKAIRRRERGGKNSSLLAWVAVASGGGVSRSILHTPNFLLLLPHPFCIRTAAYPILSFSLARRGGIESTGIQFSLSPWKIISIID
jgi:hypothetical protein